MVNQISRYAHTVAIATTILLSTPGVTDEIRDSDTQPSMELLEYLGTLTQTEDGFLGPEFFDDAIPDEPIQESDDDAPNISDKISTGRTSDHD